MRVDKGLGWYEAMGIDRGRCHEDREGMAYHRESVKYCILLFIYLFIYLLFSFSNGFHSLDVHELYVVCEMCEC